MKNIKDYGTANDTHVYSEETFAILMGCSVEKLREWREQGIGPRYSNQGYLRRDFATWCRTVTQDTVTK